MLKKIRQKKVKSIFLSVSPPDPFVAPKKQKKEAVVKMDSEGKIVKTIAEFPDVEMVVRKSGDGLIPLAFITNIILKYAFLLLMSRLFATLIPLNIKFS